MAEGFEVRGEHKECGSFVVCLDPAVGDLPEDLDAVSDLAASTPGGLHLTRVFRILIVADDHQVRRLAPTLEELGVGLDEPHIILVSVDRAYRENVGATGCWLGYRHTPSL